MNTIGVNEEKNIVVKGSYLKVIELYIGEIRYEQAKT